MNSREIVLRIEKAIDRADDYTQLGEKIAFLDGLAAVCESMVSGQPLVPFTTVWQQIKFCRQQLVNEKEVADG